MVNSSPAGVDGYVSYKYATANTPDDIKLATIYFTSAMIAMNDDLFFRKASSPSLATSSQLSPS